LRDTAVDTFDRGAEALENFDLEAAQEAFAEALPLFRQLGDVLGEANCIRGLGDIALERSDHDAARQAFNQALPLYRQVGSVLGEANSIFGLAERGQRLASASASILPSGERAADVSTPERQCIGWPE
jgi:tetratricopeptide (TPR) repeat protein